VAEVAAIGAGTPVNKPVRRGRWVPYALLAPGLLWLVVFFVVPMITLGSQSLQEGNVDEGYTFTGNVGIYADAFERYWPHLVRSIGYAASATVLALLLGYPLAYFMAQKAGRWKNILLVLVIAPFFTSFLIRTLAWRNILSDDGPVVALAQSTGFTSLLQAVGLTDNDTLLASKFAVICGLTYNFLPFMILPLYASLERLDSRLVEAAGDLYASPTEAFRRVTWPLSLPGVVAGTLLTFIPAAGDFINAELLGTPKQQMIGNVIQAKFLESLDYPTAASLSFVLMALILVGLLVYARIVGTEKLTG
jgi:spermidine/putrescine transport system permease protein